MAVIDVESRFDRWAVSSAGAVGLMQVMPFWPEQLGMKRHQLTDIAANMRMGCAILRYYLKREHNDWHKALARYNGSVGSRKYSNLVVTRWTTLWSGADELAMPTAMR
jgi:soluble lytic murein transglycosylase-like protein